MTYKKHPKRVTTQSGLEGYECRLQENYDDFADFEAHDNIYNLAKRLGYNSAQEAWDDNPLIQGSTDPTDFRKVNAAVGTYKRFLQIKTELEADLDAAKWSSKKKEALPDSAFAYVSPEGDRKLPYKSKKKGKLVVDKKHIRNALSRLAQEKTEIPEKAKPKIKKKLENALEKSKADMGLLEYLALEAEMNTIKNYILNAREYTTIDEDIFSLQESGFTDVQRLSNSWVAGLYPSGERFQASIYPEPSAYGIGSGRISKLYIWNNGEGSAVINGEPPIFNYDREYSVEGSKDPNITKLVNFICSIIDNKEPIQEGVDLGL